MRSNRQNDKLEQWVMHRAVRDEVLGTNLGSNKQKVFFHLQFCPSPETDQANVVR